jgi:hypothetical protein
MIPLWAIPLLTKVASRVIDMAFDAIEQQPEDKKEAVYDKIMKKDVKAYEKMKGNKK